MTSSNTTEDAVVVPEPVDELIGRRVAERYQIVALLGGGGMGSVYRAVDEQTGKHIAIKRLRPTGKEMANLGLFLEREYHTLAQLNHPCIIKVFDYGFDGGAPYYTMELAYGKDLREMAAVEYREACRYLRDVASSLALLHARRLLHRDISSTNVRIGADGRAKLIDFGALASFGVSTEVIGTPPYIAPEALRRETLDQRVDLFALGALAYYTLTRHHAYPARQIGLLPELWRIPLAGPRQRNPELPQELEDLVLGLLELDPMKRIGSAAWVIDRLTSIGELEPETELQSTEAYLQSAAMVGREVELKRLRQRLEQVAKGKTRVAVIHGAAGLGKSRLLSELALAAQLHGITVVRVSADLHRVPYGVARELAVGLLDAKADTALAAIEPFAGTIAHVLPELWERLPQRPLEALPIGPGEGRARIQNAFQEWFEAVSSRTPILLCVDNVEHVDDNSLAFVAALGRAQGAQKLMIVATLGESSTRADHMTTLLAPELDVPLRALKFDGTLELVQSLFGNVAGARIVAKRLHELSAGNPRHCIELARHLVTKGIIAYSEGAWVLPPELSVDDLPASLEGALTARLEALSEQARTLAETLSVSRTPLTLQQCIVLDGDDRRSVALYMRLEELVAADVLSSPGGTYYFSLDGLRESLFRRMDESRRRTLHKRLGEALLAEANATSDQRLEAGWHLLQGGERLRGADLLVAATHAIKVDRDQVPEVNAALEAALQVYEEENRPIYDRLTVRCELMQSAFYLDRNLVAKYGEKTLQLGLQYLGVTAAETWAPRIGKRLAFVLSTLWARLRHRFVYRRTAKEFGRIYSDVLTSWMVGIGIATICVDPITCKRLSTNIKPLAAFGTETLGGLIERMGRRMLLQTEGDEVGAQHLAQLDIIALSPEGIREIPPVARRRIMGGEYYGLGQLQIFRADTSALETAAKLDALGMRTYDMIAAQIRMNYHAYRGETVLASAQRERFETLAVQGGSTWQTEICVPANMVVGFSLVGDLVGLRRARHLLQQVAREVPSMASYEQNAEIWLAVLRGRYEQALELFEKIKPFIEPRKRVGWMVARHAQLVALNRLGRHREAFELGTQYVALLRPEDSAYPVLYLHVIRELAHAKAGIGDLASAVADIEGKLAELSPSEQPLMLFLLHEDRAQLAVIQRDADAFEEHIERMRHWATVAQNSMLLVRVEAAFKQGRRLGLGAEDAPGDPLRRGDQADNVLSQLGACNTQEDRARQALSLLLVQAGLNKGWLFERIGEGWVVTGARGVAPDQGQGMIGDVQAYAASLFGDDEPDLDTVSHSEKSGSTDSTSTGLTWDISLTSGVEQVKPVGFYTPTERGIELVAVAVVVLDTGRHVQLSSTYVDALAKAFHTTVVGAPEVQTLAAESLVGESA